jgi:hypothetical protein
MAKAIWQRRPKAISKWLNQRRERKYESSANIIMVAAEVMKIISVMAWQRKSSAWRKRQPYQRNVAKMARNISGVAVKMAAWRKRENKSIMKRIEMSEMKERKRENNGMKMKMAAAWRRVVMAKIIAWHQLRATIAASISKMAKISAIERKQ